MRKRTIRIQFWLNKKEAELFDKSVKRSGLSREAYLRHLVNGLVPNDAPPLDYYSMMRELHGVGNNLNQIAQKAHVLNVIDVQQYDENMRLFNQTVKNITNAVILPRRITGSPQSQLCGGKEPPRSDESFAAVGGSDKRRAR